jgi:hypothetical protein
MRLFKIIAIGLLAFSATLSPVNSTDAVQVAQALSPRCATPAGICFITPQPIGAPCSCGQFQGTIIW